jgi:SAM-dependent methyltransferase
MGAGDDDGWSAVAAEWSELWAASARPAHEALIAASAISTGSRVLDVGCGSGEFLRDLGRAGALAAGVDPAADMVALARRIAPLADVRVGGDENLPWADGSFDVVTAVNALQFADDTLAALAEFERVAVPGGLVAVANWAEGALNDLDVVERAIAEVDGAEPAPDGELRAAGGLEALLADAGFEVQASGLVAVPWEVPDDATLVRGVLLGEDASVMRELADAVVAAATPFRVADGYRLVNHYRWAVASTAG